MLPEIKLVLPKNGMKLLKEQDEFLNHSIVLLNPDTRLSKQAAGCQSSAGYFSHNNKYMSAN